MVDEQPLVKGNLRTFKHGSDGNGKLLAAIIALDQSGAVMGAKQASSIQRATMRAERTIGPIEAFKVFAGGGFVSEARCGDVHANCNGLSSVLCQVYNCPNRWEKCDKLRQEGSLIFDNIDQSIGERLWKNTEL